MFALAIASWIICGILSYAIFKGYFRNLHEEVFGKYYDDFLTGVRAELKAQGKDLSEWGLIYARETWKKKKGYRWQEELMCFGVSLQGWIALPFALLLLIVGRLNSNYRFRLCFRMPEELKSK